MASHIVGRTDCPECGFKAAHVKQSEKCLYRYCPECGATYHAKGLRQAADLQAKTRPEAGAPAPKPAASPKPSAAPVLEPADLAAITQAPAAPKRAGLFF